MNAVAALVGEARRAGIQLRIMEDGVAVAGTTPPDLLVQLRAYKGEVADILRGDRCKYCGEAIGWPTALVVTESDGLAMHLGCYERNEVEQIERQTLMSSRPLVEQKRGETS